MSPSDLEEMILETPFKPIRLTMNSGDQFVLMNPRHIVVTGTAAHLGINVDPDTGIPQRAKILALLNICSAERLDEGQIRPPRGRRRK